MIQRLGSKGISSSRAQRPLVLRTRPLYAHSSAPLARHVVVRVGGTGLAILGALALGGASFAAFASAAGKNPR